jgi:tRNA threonylcarbamoyladenosine biosynthesis protein TsaB
MLVLGLETAAAQAGVALGDAHGVRASVHLVNEGRHAEALAPAIDFVCRATGTSLNSVTAVAVDVGPGRFTGLRVGVATAKAIAFAGGVPAVPVSSLEALAYAARLSARQILSVIDALSDEVYYQTYIAVGDGVSAMSEPALGRPDALAEHLSRTAEPTLVIGDGGIRYAELFRASNHVEVAAASFQYPTASALVEIATRKLLRNEITPGEDAQILYLRNPSVHSKG